MSNKFRLLTLYSGSSGNSVFVSSGSTNILIDAGKSAKALCNALKQIGSDIKEIDAIFITHEHSDHVSALEVICKSNDIPVHITNTSAKKFDRTPDSFVHRRIVRHDPIYTETVGDITVTSFRTPHDSMMSVGYRIEFISGGEKHVFGVATDIGYISESIKEGLVGCEAVVLEANHDLQMLDDGPYPYNLKLRIKSNKGHLSNLDSACFAAYLAQNGTKRFLLAHLSAENNQPELAFDEAHCSISDPSVCIYIASPDAPTEIFFDTSEVMA